MRSTLFTFLYEAIGSAIIAFSINFIPFSNLKDMDKGYVQSTVAQAVTYTMVLFGEVSGGHFNPAVTTGVLFMQKGRNKGPILPQLGIALGMIGCQIAGGFAGVFLSLLVMPISKENYIKAKGTDRMYVPFTIDELTIRNGGKLVDANDGWFLRAAYVEMMMSAVFVSLFI